MKTWKTFILAIIILISLLTAMIFIGKALDNDTMQEIHEHNEKCSGTIHFVEVGRYAYYYKCDTCNKVFAMHELIED